MSHFLGTAQKAFRKTGSPGVQLLPALFPGCIYSLAVWKLHCIHCIHEMIREMNGRWSREQEGGAMVTLIHQYTHLAPTNDAQNCLNLMQSNLLLFALAVKHLFINM